MALILSAHQGDDDLVKKAKDIHDRVFTVDTHVDAPDILLKPGFDITKVNDINHVGIGSDFDGGSGLADKSANKHL